MHANADHSCFSNMQPSRHVQECCVTQGISQLAYAVLCAAASISELQGLHNPGLYMMPTPSCIFSFPLLQSK